jgi:PKD repeat protein
LVVSFSTDNGSLSTTSATTSFSGQAQTTLATNRDAIVTVSTGTGTGTTGTVKIVVVSLPDITITPSPTAPTEGQPVSFAIALSSASTTETFQSLSVDFGDGTSVGPLSGTSQNVSHVYSSSGTYNVIATGTSGSGNTKRGTTVITVAERGLINVTVAKSPDTAVTRNQVVMFTANATGGTVRSYNWNFGDGQTFNGSTQVSHSYSTTGTKTVTVTVTTTDGNSGRGQTQVVVTP